MARLILGIVLSIAFTALWCFALANFYQKDRYVSEETRAEIAKTLQVTPDQRAELNRSIRICDEFAFGLLGMLVGGVVGRRAERAGRPPRTARVEDSTGARIAPRRAPHAHGR